MCVTPHEGHILNAQMYRNTFKSWFFNYKILIIYFKKLNLEWYLQKLGADRCQRVLNKVLPQDFTNSLLAHL